MTIAVDWDVKHQMKQKQIQLSWMAGKELESFYDLLLMLSDRVYLFRYGSRFR